MLTNHEKLHQKNAKWTPRLLEDEKQKQEVGLQSVFKNSTRVLRGFLGLRKGKYKVNLMNQEQTVRLHVDMNIRPHAVLWEFCLLFMSKTYNKHLQLFFIWVIWSNLFPFPYRHVLIGQHVLNKMTPITWLSITGTKFYRKNYRKRTRRNPRGERMRLLGCFMMQALSKCWKKNTGGLS